ncbi:MAG: toll/interleukin-1 receptor domain-containing protein [Anaerolineae bacterium]
MSTNAQVFISYSRRNIEFTRRLVKDLSADQRDVWVDWEDIPRAADWLKEIYSGIDRADTILFLVSEESLSSEVCNQELHYALQHNKRVIPLILQPIDDALLQRVDHSWQEGNWYPIAQSNWKTLKHLNWLFFDDPAKYKTEFNVLLTTIDQDLFHIKTHTRLLVRAQEWLNKEKNPSSLLAGDDIIGAENWLQMYADTPPHPTDLHHEFIQHSRIEENKRIAHEARLQQRARQRLQILVASFILIILVMIFGLLPFTNDLLDTQLGDEVDFRLQEAAISFVEFFDEDEDLAVFAARFAANLQELALIGQDDVAVFNEVQAVREEFDLQELNIYLDGETQPAYYAEQLIDYPERVAQIRAELVQAVFNDGEERSRIVIGAPDSQIIAVVPIPTSTNSSWSVDGVVLASYAIDNAYVEDLAISLNIEAAIANIEEQIVATTLLDTTQFQMTMANYQDRNLYNTEPVYIDYITEDNSILRMISMPLIVSDAEQGFLFVADSFEAVLALQDQIVLTFLIFSGAILALVIVLVLMLVGVPAWRERQRTDQTV